MIQCGRCVGSFICMAPATWFRRSEEYIYTYGLSSKNGMPTVSIEQIWITRCDQHRLVSFLDDVDLTYDEYICSRVLDT